MTMYIFESHEMAKRFVLEVLVFSEIRNFEFKFNYVKIFEEVPQDLKEKVKLYEGKEKHH